MNEKRNHQRSTPAEQGSCSVPPALPEGPVTAGQPGKRTGQSFGCCLQYCVDGSSFPQVWEKACNPSTRKAEVGGKITRSSKAAWLT